jgi:DNA (cytosine-5)-methyltransferase 1
MHMDRLPLLVDLFCGAGGLSLGFEQAGFECVLAIDHEQEMVDTYNHNRERKVAVVMDARDVTKALVMHKAGGKAPDAVIGGFPCQGYSLAGKRNTMDPRNSMVDEFFRIIEDVRPRYFVGENVPGILSMMRPDRKSSVVEWIEHRVRRMGYGMRWKKLMAHHYGVGQARPRIFFVGWDLDEKAGASAPIFPPPVTHSNDRNTDLFGKKFLPYVTVGDVLASIPPDAPNHVLMYEMSNPDYIEKVKKLGPGEFVYDNYHGAHRRLDPSKPAFTMKQNHGSVGIHPTETRMIDLREMAAIQNFPNDYEFLGDASKIGVMIGNAVPVGLARAIAVQIKKAMS